MEAISMANGEIATQYVLNPPKIKNIFVVTGIAYGKIIKKELTGDSIRKVTMTARSAKVIVQTTKIALESSVVEIYIIVAGGNVEDVLVNLSKQ